MKKTNFLLVLGATIFFMAELGFSQEQDSTEWITIGFTVPWNAGGIDSSRIKIDDFSWGYLHNVEPYELGRIKSVSYVTRPLVENEPQFYSTQLVVEGVDFYGCLGGDKVIALSPMIENCIPITKGVNKEKNAVYFVYLSADSLGRGTAEYLRYKAQYFYLEEGITRDGKRIRVLHPGEFEKDYNISKCTEPGPAHYIDSYIHMAHQWTGPYPGFKLVTINKRKVESYNASPCMCAFSRLFVETLRPKSVDKILYNGFILSEINTMFKDLKAGKEYWVEQCGTCFKAKYHKMAYMPYFGLGTTPYLEFRADDENNTSFFVMCTGLSGGDVPKRLEMGKIVPAELGEVHYQKDGEWHIAR